jgi:lysophospholipase L1-like esterase
VKRRAFVPLFVLVLLLALLPAQALAVSPVRYTALGDSIAVGVGATNSYGYVYRFRDYLATQYARVELSNRAISGMNSTELYLQLRADPITRRDVRRADVITISIGGNNLLPCAQNNYEILLPACGDVGVALFQQDWPRIVAEIRSLNPDAELFVITLYNPFRGDEQNYALADSYIDRINAVIQDPANVAAGNYEIVDVYTDFQGQFGDGTWKVCVYTHFCEERRDPHPTDAGHARIAELHAAIYP